MMWYRWVMGWLTLCGAMTTQAAMTGLEDADLQQVTGQDGLSMVLSDNFGFRVYDLPPSQGTGFALPNSFRFTSPRRAKNLQGQYVDLDKDYVELSDLELQTSRYAPIDDPLRIELFKLSDGRAAIAFKSPQNADQQGKHSWGMTLTSSAPVYLDNSDDITQARLPERWTLGRVQFSDIVQQASELQLSAAGDGFGFEWQTEMKIGALLISPRFTRNPDQSLTVLDDETWTLTNISLCGSLINDSCVAGTRFKFGDSVAGALVMKAEQLDGKPTLTLTMGNVNVQAREGNIPLASGSIVVDSMKVQSNRCTGGVCDFGKQILGDIKIYSMRVKLRDL
ncbi:hypothetical protein [Chitinivorax sp. B]|uniref:hypothetical protein n=1 Tax=Chitinivorax sp. B TaxID=2502235 RepID=UPI0010F5965F|nr:hypothetical protein [Chitinivorax sp. B]